MDLYDPLEKYGNSWRRFQDGHERRVIEHGGRYYFQDRHSQELIAIPNTITPEQRRNTPRTTLHESLQPQSGDNQRRPSGGFNLQGGGREPRPAPDRADASPGHVTSNVPIRTRRLSQSQQETSTIGAASHLPNTVFYAFIQIGYNDFQECSRFIDHNPTILLPTGLESFLDAAVQARSNQNDMLSLRCIQRCVIIKACRDLSTEDRRDYLAGLGLRDPQDSHWQEYFNDFTAMSDEVTRRFREGSRSLQRQEAHPPGPQGRSHDPADVLAYRTALPADRGASYASHTRSGVTHIGSADNPPPLAYSQPTASPAGAPRGELPSMESFRSAPGIQTQAGATFGKDMQSAATAGPLSQTSTTYQQDARKSRAHSRSSNSHERHDYKHKLPTAGGIENVEFRGDKENQRVADSEQLDPRYILRSDGADFFSEGKVFSFMHHEPFGLKRGDAPPRDSDSRVSKGPMGTYIHSKIRWMAVVRKRHGYSICVPIISYGGRGVGQKKMGPEMQAHAIAYPSNQDPPPGPLAGEPQFKKRPIAVDLNEGHDLRAASRIHFGKLQYVEWNVKVMDIGRIARESMADFEAYWKVEHLPRARP